MTTFYKAVRPDGTDFRTGTVQWARVGEVVAHPSSTKAVRVDFSTFLSVSTDPTRLPGSSWPLRLFEVEPAAPLVEVDEHKRGAVAFRVLREVDPSQRFGPMGVHVVALIDRASVLTYDEVRRLNAARAAAWDAARDAAWHAARAAAWDAAWDAARVAARDAAWHAARAAARDAAWHAARVAAWDAARHAAAALAIRDLIGQHEFTQAHYDALTGPWRTVVGSIHPDDKELS